MSMQQTSGGPLPQGYGGGNAGAGVTDVVTQLQAIVQQLSAWVKAFTFETLNVISASSGNVANGTASAILAAATGATTYITGFIVQSAGAAGALVVTVTVSGVNTPGQTGAQAHTLFFTYATVAGTSVQNRDLVVIFPAPIPASAPNSPITVSCPALGSGNAFTTVSAFGFQR